MEISLLALWFVCGLGTAVFAAAAPGSRTATLIGGATFVAAAWWARQPFAPSTSAVGIGLALVAAAELTRARRPALLLAVAGGLAGIWTGVLEAQGLPLLVAVTFAAGVPIVSARLLARRPAFAPAVLREEALLVMVVLGVTAAAAPGINEGWHAAINLNLRSDAATPDAAMPAWTLVVASGALISGGLFSVWSRR